MPTRKLVATWQFRLSGRRKLPSPPIYQSFISFCWRIFSTIDEFLLSDTDFMDELASSSIELNFVVRESNLWIISSRKSLAFFFMSFSSKSSQRLVGAEAQPGTFSSIGDSGSFTGDASTFSITGMFLSFSVFYLPLVSSTTTGSDFSSIGDMLRVSIRHAQKK